MKKLALSLITTAVALTFTVGVAQAQEKQFVVKAGIAAVIPKSNNGTLKVPAVKGDLADYLAGTGDLHSTASLKADVGTSVRPSIVLEYFVTPNLGIEVLGAWPFRSNVSLKGVGKSVRVEYLPPTVSANWHFLPGNIVDPFVGLGLNYTFFYSERETDKLKGAVAAINGLPTVDGLLGTNYSNKTSIDIKNTFGIALHGGVDVNLDKNWVITADLRWISIRPKVRENKLVSALAKDGITGPALKSDLGKAKIDPWVLGVSVGYRF